MATNLVETYCPVCKLKKKPHMMITDYRFKETNHFLPCCRACTDRIVSQHAAKNNLVVGVWSAAMMNHVPFIHQAWDAAVEKMAQADIKSPFAAYYHCLKENFGDYEGVWQTNAWLGDYISVNGAMEKNDLFTEEELETLFKDWGRFVDEDTGELDLSAYEYLVARYNEYTEGVTGLTSAMSMQFRNLCKAEWQKIKADETGDIGAIDKAQKLVNGLLSSLKLDDFAVEKSDTDRFIDRLIWRIEETEPSEVEDESKYVDIAGYEQYYNSIMRSMKNLIAGSRDYPDIPTEEM